MCNEMKGNIFAFRFLISYPNIIQYVIHIMLLFILFLYWEMLKKNVTVAIMMHTEKAVSRVPSDCDCPLFVGSNVTEEGIILDQQEMISECARFVDCKTAISIIICALM